MLEMTAEHALIILDRATQPGVKLMRMDYISIQSALELLAKLLAPQSPQTEADSDSAPVA